MIHVEGIKKEYGGRTLFEEVSFSVEAGERIGLVGRNGHGKTTLFRLLLGKEHPDEGEIRIPKGYTLGHLSQKIRFSEATVLAEGCRGLVPAEDGRDETYRVEAVLTGLGFAPEDFLRRPSELSGGYQVRLNLAKVLVSEPNLLLLDEPTNYLDIVSMRWLARFLLNWKQALILITHDREFLDGVTTHTLGIHRGRVRKIRGDTRKLYEQLLQEEEVYEQTRRNDEKKRKELEQFIRRFRAKASKARAVQSRIKTLEREERQEALGKIENLAFTFPFSPFSGKWPMEVRDLRFSFTPESPPLVEGLTFWVGPRDRIGVIGKNGKGKTTLLNLLAGDLTPAAGRVLRHQNTRIASFGQTNVERLSAERTVEEEILLTHSAVERKQARSICGAMMFGGDLALKKVGVLSGGEKSRVLLGKLLVRPSNLLLLDEPTNHLDMESTESLLAAVAAYPGAVIFVTHSEMLLHALATRLIIFDGGRTTLFEGTYRDFLERVGWEEEKGDAVEEEKPKEAALSLNRKEMRRLRAGIVAEKSKVLGALNGRIKKMEEEIAHLEEEEKSISRLLLAASEEGDGAAIAGHSRRLHEAQEKLSTLYAEWETLTEEREEKQKEFDRRLEEAE